METIRFDTADLCADRLEAVLAWVRSLGLDPNEFAARAAIVPAEKGWQLHLSRFIRDERGSIRLDVAREECVTEPVIVDLGPERTWPDLGLKVASRPVTVHLKVWDEASAREVGEDIVKAIRAFRGRS